MKELTSPAREILDHLLQHPDACDTFDGIAHWWLLEQQLRTWLPRVDQAIQELVALGLLQATCGPDGIIRYRGNPVAVAAVRHEAAEPSHPERSARRGVRAPLRPRTPSPDTSSPSAP